MAGKEKRDVRLARAPRPENTFGEPEARGRGKAQLRLKVLKPLSQFRGPGGHDRRARLPMPERALQMSRQVGEFGLGEGRRLCQQHANLFHQFSKRVRRQQE